MLSFTEFHSWLSIRPIELLFILFGWFSFSILLVLRYDFHFYSITYFHLFLPLFLTNAIHLYFILMVLLRLWFEQKQKSSLAPAYAYRLIVHKIFTHVPLIVCLIMFNNLLYKAFINKQLLSTNVFHHCMVPLYLFVGWMFLKIFICKKQSNITIAAQS
ncbi:unnamed protein product [Rotaria socialis]|uniref:Uncharacterized protein n=1 Tax=Rotaria socialis TaxID=392032 RepID=A0A820V2J9_9BILA|nr:unnamed protein product [Rotaria socialis]CAF3329671.1 unnamed protein product [Rotaria socialis]CAF3648197.1 unnamed protein product [Rotaria socialis]CAF3679820.1 unnamed protein product [Rotaria socialis]CAF3743814.1 unnamed protein product [Rotaria socialis]